MTMSKETANDTTVNDTTRNNKVDIAEFTNQFIDFIDAFDSLQLATVDRDGMPEASYAPYVKLGNDYYIYVSELSKHTGNLLDNGKVSLLLIESEQDAKHLFARKRVTYRASSLEVGRGSDDFNAIMKLFEEKFGKFMAMLINLNDFHLFRIRPDSGNFVAGFARAFHLEGENLDQLRHVNDVGHAAADKKTEKMMEAEV